MPIQTIFHGTEHEATLLTTILAKYCACQANVLNHTPCTVCSMRLYDQRAINGLLWMHRHAQRLIQAELR